MSGIEDRAYGAKTGQFHSETSTAATEETEPETVVVFRVDPKDGDVTAVFPEEPADQSGRLMLCYAHIGQHGGCSIGWYRGQRNATPEQYASLKAELEQIGYKLKIRRQITSYMLFKRKENARR